MRTTLKRGAGREWAGGPPDEPPNGRLATAPLPHSLGPVARYGRHRGGMRVAARVLMWLVAFVLVAAGALGGGIWLYLEESVATVNENSQGIQNAIEEEGEDVIAAAPEPGKATNVLVIGYDARAGEEADPGRSDTVMLVRADPARDTLSLLSFPRDLVVDHPGCKAHPEPWRDRINTAYTLCGPIGTAKTVHALTRVRPNYILTVNFHGFKEIVNKVGGVWVDVDRRYYNPTGGVYARINLQPGYQRLTGGAALDYARYRHTDSDFHRIARQQQFVKAFKQAVSANFSITKIPGIIDVVIDSVHVAGRKDIELDELVGYARFVYELPGGSFFQVRLDTSEVTGYAELQASPEAIQGAVRDFLNPDVKAAQKAAAAAAGKQPTSTAPKPEETNIELLNGNGVEGSADSAAFALGERGYTKTIVGGNALDEVGNAKWDYFETVVQYSPAVAGAQAAAKQVAKLFGEAVVEPVPADVELQTMLRVIVGQTFHNTLAPAPEDDTPEHAPPAVVHDFADVLPHLRQARRKVDFPLLVPTVKEQASSLDTEAPIRVYSVNRHPGVKLVYRTSSVGGYWGVMQTSWVDAPIATGWNSVRRAGGRELHLHFNGSKLSMISFQENGAVYWVTNTLLNELSNETMIAIAKGLKPLATVQ